MHMRSVANYAAVLMVLAGAWVAPDHAWAHCDSLEGPVVEDARLALEKGDPTPVLKWVSEQHEGEIRVAFEQTLAVRAKGDGARDLADRYFFETLVRIHRAGEGEAFAGLKPASSVDPGIAAADKALKVGSADELAKHMSAAVSEGIRSRFAVVLERKKHAAASVEAGRAFVEAYVDYIHFVESINRLTSHGAPRTHHDSVPHVGR